MARQAEQIADSTLRLLLAPGVGPATLRRLRAHFDDDDQIAGASVQRLTEINGIARKSADALRRAIDDTEPDLERQRMVEHDTAMIMLGDDDYPPLLAAIDDPPVALWVRGQVTSADNLAIGLVGSRKCSTYGREQADRFAAMLVQCGYTVCSGGALGIDGAAHRAALRTGGRTIAVMGCGLSRSYPPEHRDLFEQIVRDGGALLSEFPMDAEPRAEHFPRRNRIISGLCVGVVVIEASQRSGALITARLAAEEHGREVMAVPGRVDSPASIGCHKAIREGWAALVTSPTDVIAQLESAGHLVRGAVASAGSAGDAQDQSGKAVEISESQGRIVDVLRDAGRVLRIDELARLCGIPMGTLMSELTMLEMRGQVRRDHRGVEVRRR